MKTTDEIERDCECPRYDDGEAMWTPELDERIQHTGKWVRVTVVRSFSRWSTAFGDYPELYQVRYEDGSTRNFLPHALHYQPHGDPA